jgi:protein O-mannosyl-transferase
MTARVQSSQSSARASPRWPLFVLPLCVLLAYARAFFNPFLYGDDEAFITRNQYLLHWRFLPELLTRNIQAGSGMASNLYRPVQSLHYFFLMQIFGPAPWAFHAVGVLYHAANAALLYLLLREFLEDSVPAHVPALLALAWAIHPIQVEDVATANGLATPLYVFWTLSACLLFLKDRFWAALGAAALAIGSKEAAVITAPLLAIIDWAAVRLGRRQPRTWRQNALRHGPQWILAGAYVWLRLTILNFGGTTDFYAHPNVFTEHWTYRLYTLWTALAYGLRLLIWPSGLHPERSWIVYTSFWSAPVLGSLAVSVFLGLLCLRWIKTKPLAAAGILWFFVAYAPMSNLVAVIDALFWEHWFYLPSVGVILAAAGLWRRGKRPGPEKTAAVLLAALAGAYGVMTFRRNFEFRSQEAYSRYILSYEPRSAKHWSNLAAALSDQGRYREAVADFSRAIALDDEYPQTRYDLGNVYMALGRSDLAEPQYEAALRLNPRFYFAYLGLARVHWAQGRRARAAGDLRKSLEIFPDQPGVRKVLAAWGGR